MLFVHTRNECHDLRWLCGINTTTPENGGKKTCPPYLTDRKSQLIAERLEQAGVICDAREGLLRFCPDILNTQEELMIAVEKLAAILTVNR